MLFALRVLPEHVHHQLSANGFETRMGVMVKRAGLKEK